MIKGGAYQQVTAVTLQTGQRQEAVELTGRVIDLSFR